MIIVRMVFQASYGKGGELAAAMAASAKQVVAEMGGDHRWKVMTDLSGPFDTVVQEIEVASLAEWEGNNSYWTTGDWADQHTEVRYHDFWNGYYQLDATTRRTVQIFQVHIDPLNV